MSDPIGTLTSEGWETDQDALDAERALPVRIVAGDAGGGGGGDASAANQVTGNTSLASIDGKLPALSSGRVPVTVPEGYATTVKQDATIDAIDASAIPLTSIVSGTTANTDGALTSVIAAQGAGVTTYLTDITLTNSSSSGVLVEVKSGATTMWQAYIPAGGGITESRSVPLVGGLNEAWGIDAAAATSTIYAVFGGFKQ